MHIRQRKLLFFAIMLLIPFLVLETILQLCYRMRYGRFLYERVELPIYAPDADRYYKVRPQLNYRHRTNEYDVVYYTNRQSFRTDARQVDISVNKGDNVFRILFLGPSFTFGWANNYQDIYPTMLGERLAIAGKTVEVMNLGTPAQPMNYQLCWLQKTGYRFQPDVIAQTIYGFPTNVSAGCFAPQRPPTVKDGYLYLSPPSFSQKLFSAAKNSAIIVYAWYLYQFIIPKSHNPQGLGIELDERRPSLTDGDEPDRTIVAFRQYLEFIKQTLAYEPPVVFIFIPFSYVVRPEDMARWNRQLVWDADALRKQAREVAELLAQAHIPFVNTTDALIANDSDARMYYFLDIHLTPAGNKVVAEQALPVLRFGSPTSLSASCASRDAGDPSRSEQCTF